MTRKEETTQEKQIRVVTPPYVPGRTDEEIATLLREHGCVIRRFLENQEVIFPIGTKSVVQLITSAARYLLTLPTGLIVTQVEAPNRDHWLLFVDMWTVQREDNNGE